MMGSVDKITTDLVDGLDQSHVMTSHMTLPGSGVLLNGDTPKSYFTYY